MSKEVEHIEILEKWNLISYYVYDMVAFPPINQ